MNRKYISFVAVLLAAGNVSAVTGQWDAGTGNWNVGTNWDPNGTPGVPGNASFDVATLGTEGTGNPTITLQDNSSNPTNVELYQLYFSSNANSYTILQQSSSTKIIMTGQDVTETDTLISVTAGSHTISAPVQLNFGTALEVSNGSSLTFSPNGTVVMSDYGLAVSLGSGAIGTVTNFATMAPASLSVENTNLNNDNLTHSGAYNAGAEINPADSFSFYATDSNTSTFNNYYQVNTGTVQLGGSDGTTNVYNDYHYYNVMTHDSYEAQILASGDIDIGNGSGITNVYNQASSNSISTSGSDVYFTIGSSSGQTNVYNNGDSSSLSAGGGLVGTGAYIVIGNGSGTTTVENNGENSSIYTEGALSLIYIGNGPYTAAVTSVTNANNNASISTDGDRSTIIGGSGSGTTTIANTASDTYIYTYGTYSSIILGSGTGTTTITNGGEESYIYTENLFSDINIGSGSGVTTLTNSGGSAAIYTEDPTSNIILGSGSGTTIVTNNGPDAYITSANNLSIGSSSGTTIVNNEGCDAYLMAGYGYDGPTGSGTIYLGVDGQGFTTINNENSTTDCTAFIFSYGNIAVSGANTVVYNSDNADIDAYGSMTVNNGLVSNTSGAGLLTEYSTQLSMAGGHIFNDASSDLGNPDLNYFISKGVLENNANSNQSGSFNANNYNQFSGGTLKLGVTNTSAYGALHADGAASLNGNLIVDALSGSSFSTNDVLTLINASGGRSGTFSSVELQGFQRSLVGSLLYGANTVDLVFANVLGPVNSYPGGGVTNMVFLATNQNNLQALRKMDQLRGRMAPVGSQFSSLMAFSDDVLFDSGDLFAARDTNITQKQRSLTDKSANGEKKPARIYAGPTFSVGTVDRDGRQLGFHYDSVGVFAGFDYAMDQFGFGFSADYQALGADVKKGWGDFQINQIIGSFYTIYSPYYARELSVNGIIGGGYETYSFNHVAGPSFATQRAKGNTNGTTFDALLGVEYAVDCCMWSKIPKGCRIIPLADLQYIHLNKNGYKENNAGVYNLTVEKESLNSLRTTVGARFDRLVKRGDWVFRPQLDIAWQYEYLNQDRTVNFDALSALNTGSGVNFLPIPAGRSTLLFGVDLLFVCDKRFEIEFSYDLECNKLFLDNSFYVDVGVNF